MSTVIKSKKFHEFYFYVLSPRSRRHGQHETREQRGERHRLGQLEEDQDRVHQQPTAGTGTGVRQQHVPVATPAHRDRQLSAAVRKTGEDLVPEQAGQAQEGSRTDNGTGTGDQRVVLQLFEIVSPVVRGVARVSAGRGPR